MKFSGRKIKRTIPITRQIHKVPTFVDQEMIYELSLPCTKYNIKGKGKSKRLKEVFICVHVFINDKNRNQTHL